MTGELFCLPGDGDDSIPQTFEWDVELENDLGGYYSLRIVQGAQTVDSAPINIIDDEGRGAANPPPTATVSGAGSASGVLTTPTVSTPGTSLTSTTQTSTPGLSTSLVSATSTQANGSLVSGSAAASPSPQQPQNRDASSSSLGGGAIAGIVIGVLAFLAFLGVAVWIFLRRRKRMHTAGQRASTQFHIDEEKPRRQNGDEFIAPSAFADVFGTDPNSPKEPTATDRTNADGPKLGSYDRPQQTPELQDMRRSDGSVSGHHDLHSYGNKMENGVRASMTTVGPTSCTHVNPLSASELSGSELTESQRHNSEADSSHDRRSQVGSTVPGNQGPPTIHELG